MWRNWNSDSLLVGMEMTQPLEKLSFLFFLVVFEMELRAKDL
jgi:hypothetical protein